MNNIKWFNFRMNDSIEIKKDMIVETFDEPGEMAYNTWYRIKNKDGKILHEIRKNSLESIEYR